MLCADEDRHEAGTDEYRSGIQYGQAWNRCSQQYAHGGEQAADHQWLAYAYAINHTAHGHGQHHGKQSE